MNTACTKQRRGLALAFIVGAAALVIDPATAAPPAPVWSADLGNGQYRNPVLHADYSDPDAIRVGDTFYMTSSSFSNAPGLPLLQSTDMVNWELVGHALPKVPPESVFAKPQPGKGVWAPSLRHHAGKFWIFYGDPDAGVYVLTSEKFAGPWSAPHLLLPGKGIIDPTPLWDADGQAWLMHAWAKSRSGINNILTLRKMAPDGSQMLDEKGRDVIDGSRLPGYFTIEGPKLYKAGGYYYVFAPVGGVEHGWQTVFRSRRIEGPYEERIVLAQGMSAINGPHQGAWVDGVDGRDWFYHFQDKGAYGRVVHLEPMVWRDGWPVIGVDADGDGVGEPVLQHTKPAGRARGLLVPATSDEFEGRQLGFQWQWNANPERDWFSLTARKGYLRLYGRQAAQGTSLRDVPSVLTQKFSAPGFRADTVVVLGTQEGQRAGLAVLGIRYAWLGIHREGKETRLKFATCEAPVEKCVERSETLATVSDGKPVYLRVQVSADAMAQFYYSQNNEDFTPVARPFKASAGRWVGAQLALFSTALPVTGAQRPYADFGYFRVTPSVVR